MQTKQCDHARYSKDCRVCNHLEREEIEKLILKNVGFEKIGKKYKISYHAILKHWKEHMNKPLDHITNDLLEKEAIKRKDSIKEVTNLITDINNASTEIKKMIVESSKAKDTELLLEAVKIFKQMATVSVSAIKLNNQLLGDSGKTRGAINLIESIEDLRSEVDDIKKKEELESDA